jgi:hypothetical protein
MLVTANTNLGFQRAEQQSSAIDAGKSDDARISSYVTVKLLLFVI